MPEGREVGPSGIYTRNLWDAGEAAFNRAYGGYLEGKLKPEYEEIDDIKAKAAAAAAARPKPVAEAKG